MLPLRLLRASTARTRPGATTSRPSTSPRPDAARRWRCAGRPATCRCAGRAPAVVGRRPARRTARRGRRRRSANAVVGAAPGSSLRSALRAVTGLSADAAAAAVRHGSGSRRGSRSGRRCASAEPQASVAVFPTCLVEYQRRRSVRPGQGLRAQRHRVPAAVGDSAAAAQPLLHAGDSTGFAGGRANVAVLAAAVREATTSSSPQPTCALGAPRRTTRRTCRAATPSWWPPTPSTPPSTCEGSTGRRRRCSTRASPARCRRRSRTTCPATCAPRDRPRRPRPARSSPARGSCWPSSAAGPTACGGWRRRTTPPRRRPADAALEAEIGAAAGSVVVAGDCHLANTADRRADRRRHHVTRCRCSLAPTASPRSADATARAVIAPQRKSVTLPLVKPHLANLDSAAPTRGRSRGRTAEEGRKS